MHGYQALAAWLGEPGEGCIMAAELRIFERKRLVPCGFISSIDGVNGKIHLTMTKRQVRAAPLYRPIEHSSESGRYDDYYGTT
jgi:hypothetical protein